MFFITLVFKFTQCCLFFVAFFKIKPFQLWIPNNITIWKMKDYHYRLDADSLQYITQFPSSCTHWTSKLWVQSHLSCRGAVFPLVYWPVSWCGRRICSWVWPRRRWDGGGPTMAGTSSTSVKRSHYGRSTSLRFVLELILQSRYPACAPSPPSSFTGSSPGLL